MYNVPNATHGLEVQIFLKTEMDKLKRHEKEFMQYFQTLPIFAPNILSHILIGGRPIETIIHRRMLGLLMNIRRKDSIEAELGRRQLAIKNSKSQSWFIRTNEVANKYGLPNSYTVMEEPPWDKQSWKTVVKKAIANYQEEIWKEELSSLSTLNFINPETISFGVAHPVWETSGYSRQNVKMAISEVRFLTDTLMTGEKLNTMYGNRVHILLDCDLYNEQRDFCVQEIYKTIKLQHPEIPLSTITNRTVLMHLILDPTWYRIDIGSPTKVMPNILSIEEANKIEITGRTFCFQIYRQRFNMMSEMENSSDSETSCDDSFSLHDTSSDNDSELDCFYNDD